MKGRAMTLQWHRMTARNRREAVHVHVMGKELPTDEQMIGEAIHVWRTQPDARSFQTFGGFMALPVPGDAPTVEPYTVDYLNCHQSCALVIEAMRARGLSVWLSNNSGKWVCAFTTPNDPTEPSADAVADTMPEAVALCALRAVGVTVE